MKNFFILFKLNIKDLWKNNRFLFCLILAFMFLSFSFVFFSFSIFSHKVFNNGGFRKRSFDIKISSTQELEEKLDNLIKKDKNIDAIYLYFDNPNLEKASGFKNKIVAVYYGKLDANVIYGKWFTNSQMKNGERVIVAPNYESFYRLNKDMIEYKIGSTYSIDGENFTIIGEFTGFNDVLFLPYNSLTDKSRFTNVDIVVEEVFNEVKTINYGADLAKLFGGQVKKYAEVRSLVFDNILKAIYVIVLSLGIINLSFIYQYLIQLRKNLLGLFKIYGLSKDKCVNYLLCEFLIWLLCCFVVSALLTHIFLYFAKTFGWFTVRMFGIWEYIFFLGLYVLLYYLVMSPIILYSVKSNNELNLVTDRKGD